MSEFNFDRRDIQFVLFEHLKVQDLTRIERFEDYNRELCEMVLDGAGKFSKDKLAPINHQVDQEGCHFENGKVTVPKVFHELYKEFKEGGWVAPHHSLDYGGQNMPLALNSANMELFIGACSSFTFYPGLTASAGHLIETFGTQDLIDRFVEKLYTGEWTGTMCLTEPQAGSAVGDIKTTATPNDDGTYSIQGTKIFISAGDHDLAENIIHMVLAKVKGDPDNIKGISLFIVPKYWVNEDGSIGEWNDVSTANIEHKMGIHACSTCTLNFGDNGKCRGILIGERTKGINAMFQMMNEARMACGLQGTAIGNAAYRSALDYAKERIQGTAIKGLRDPNAPRVKIIEHPDVRRMLAEMRAYGEGIRALLYQAAYFFDLAHHSPDEEERKQSKMLLDLMTPICKAYATDKGFKMTELAIQTYGGYGYISEYPVEQYMRDLKIASLYEGTNGIQAMDLLGRKMTMKNGALFLTYLQRINEFIEKHKDHETLKGLIKALEDAKNALAEIAFLFAGLGRKDVNLSMLNASPFLEMFGDLMVGELLIQQALIAHEKLQNLSEDSADGKFYSDKIKTATFFAYNIMPRVQITAKRIKAKDRSALEMNF